MQATMQIAQVDMPTIAESEAGKDGQVGLGLEQAFRDHKDLVFRAAYRVTGNASDAEDVLQTVFLRLARQERLAEVKNARAYLHRAAVNAALDLLRTKKDAQTVSIEDEAGAAATVSAMAKDIGPGPDDMRQWLRQRLGLLNPKWAEMFVLRFIEEYSNREIAAVMNTSPAVVAVVLHRTRSQLKKDIKALTMTRGRR
jgi:RNA polymerase sigma-70 factor (ECF subfamily)